jgi:PAS domain S-box-containing protein
LINTSNFFIALYDEKDQMISFPYYVDEFDQPPQPRKMGSGLTDQVLRTGVPLLTTPEVPKLIEGQGLTLIGTPSVEWAGVPMKVGGRTIGALVVQTYRKAEKFGEDALSILGFMSDNIALAIERKNVEMEIIQNNDTQNALAALLNLSLEDISLEKLLNNTIDIILSIPWLALESRGSIFMVEDDQEVLVMKAQRNLAHPIQQACARVPFGKCFCGRAAMTGQIQFANCLDDLHEITYSEIIPHGHYCVPILMGQKTLGVINLYIKEGHHRSKMEETFLTTMADALAGVINRKKIEGELRKMSTAVEQSANIIVITDISANINYVNQAFVDLTGYSREEVLGKNPRILKSGEMDRSAYEQMWRILAGGGKWQGEFHNKKKNGDLYWEQATITSIRDEQGKPVFYMAIKEDITMRRGLEEERERLIVELQDSLDNVKTLKGLVPICASCKKIRDDGGYWQQVEEYVAKHTEADFSHGLCDECAHTLYPEYFKDKKNKTEGEEIG